MYWPIGAPNIYRQPSSLDWSDTNVQDDGGIDDCRDAANDNIVAATPSRGGAVFVTITPNSVTIWQTKPMVALAACRRSSQCLKDHGENISFALRPDASEIVVHTASSYLLTYTTTLDPHNFVLVPQFAEHGRHARKVSVDVDAGYRKGLAGNSTDAVPGEGEGVREVGIQFGTVTHVNGSIRCVVALDTEYLVATASPSSIKTFRWSVNREADQPTEDVALEDISGVIAPCSISEMVYDRPMNVQCWITDDGRSYAVQRRVSGDSSKARPTLQAYCFREAAIDSIAATRTAINARLSLIAIGCIDGSIEVYLVKDYTGNIPLSHRHRLSTSPSTTGKLTFLSYSPDGYCLLAGYEYGWAMWSAYGKPGATSFAADKELAQVDGEQYLRGVSGAFWTGGGSELALVGINDRRIWVLDIARSAATGCFNNANVANGLLQSSTGVLIYKGTNVSDLTSMSADSTLWHAIQTPSSYLASNWPIRLSVISADGKYVAVAGKRGLAHYSCASGRWRTFEDPVAESSFAVRGGMCWYHHILVAAVESGTSYELRLYSRDKALGHNEAICTQPLSAPVINVSTTGTDSLLVYTHDNALLHFVIASDSTSVKLIQMGQIGLEGIIRAPPRVRAVSWILPEDQLENGDPAQDVARASVLLLVDGKLVLLQPSRNEDGELKYDMRVVAPKVETYLLLRDLTPSLPSAPDRALTLGVPGTELEHHTLRDSLWYFDGSVVNVWSDVHDVLTSAPADLGRDLPAPVCIPVDFYPLSPMILKGIIHGLDAEIVQRRDVKFSYFRQVSRTQLFLPHLLRHEISEYNTPAAIHLSNSFTHLPYFPHALEVLLHDILDAEVDSPPDPPETALLPTTLSFISSFDSYLDVVVNCTRKTELRSWRTLFSYLPPVYDLFEQALENDKVKTAAGYLLVLYTIEKESFSVAEFARVFRRAAGDGDWELAKELSRFLVGIDSTGTALRAALADAGLRDESRRSSHHGNLSRRNSISSVGSNTHQTPTSATNGERRFSKYVQRADGGFMDDYFSFPRQISVSTMPNVATTVQEEKEDID